MVIGACIVQLYLPAVASLKDKRGLLKSLIARLHKEFNISAAEVDYHDVWHSTALGVATVSTSAVHAQNLLDNLVHWIESNRPDLEVVDHYIEIISFSEDSGS